MSCFLKDYSLFLGLSTTNDWLMKGLQQLNNLASIWDNCYGHASSIAPCEKKASGSIAWQSNYSLCLISFLPSLINKWYFWDHFPIIIWMQICISETVSKTMVNYTFPNQKNNSTKMNPFLFWKIKTLNTQEKILWFFFSHYN